MSNAHPGRVLPQDVQPEDGSGEVLTALPVSQSEIDDLLYGDDRPAGERIERLQELAGILRDGDAGDYGGHRGGHDAGALVTEIEGAVARLRGDMDSSLDVEFDATSMDNDPLAHRETLSPDSDELDSIEERDEASLTDGTEPLTDDVLDPEEWDDGDGFNADRGVQ